MAVGNLAAIAQTNIKRMLAYSTISHMVSCDRLLAGVVNGTGSMRPTPIAPPCSTSWSTCSPHWALRHGLLLSRAGFEAENLEDFRLKRAQPMVRLHHAALMFSLAGVPPTSALRQNCRAAAAARGGHGVARRCGGVVLPHRRVLLPRIVKLMYFDEPTDTAPIAPTLDVSVLISATAWRCSRSHHAAVADGAVLLLH